MTRRNLNGDRSWRKDEWARIYVDDSADSAEAINLLQAKGYAVHSLRVAGKYGPRLLLGRHVIDGLTEIKRFLGKVR